MRRSPAAVATGKSVPSGVCRYAHAPGLGRRADHPEIVGSRPALQVVICSAYSAYSWKEIADKLGTSDRLLILKKPFDELEVFQIANSQTAKWLVTQQAQLKLSELETACRGADGRVEADGAGGSSLRGCPIASC